MIGEDLQKFSESRVMRTIAIGRVPIRNLPKSKIQEFFRRNTNPAPMTSHHANPIGQKPVKIGVACFYNRRVVISITPRHLDWALSESRSGGVF
ncbi:hypothetical protein AVEN_208214-1 [Araneus ventricosus]|uniref:Uncharacterized protein n=1 Tax=Araneus ventricosus TaxID=182803 RepID=A0A4Y2LIU5_ARAVE|nr:hypothetical protein AVEN_208214-1 [Araneus ventricosus]